MNTHRLIKVFAATTILVFSAVSGITTVNAAATTSVTQAVKVRPAVSQRPIGVRPPQTKPFPARPTVSSFGVDITSLRTKMYSGVQGRIKASSWGFADGNWANVWIRPVGQSAWTDGGGNWVNAGNFSIPVAYPKAGDWQVQLSLGAWPAEQYSQIVTVTVKAGRSSTPFVVEAGAAGHRYLKVSGVTNNKAGSLVYLWVKKPKTSQAAYGMWATVGDGGYYLFNHANGATLLDAGPGVYKIVVTSGPDIHLVVGKVKYTDY